MSCNPSSNQSGFQALAQFNAESSSRGSSTPKKAPRTTFSTNASPSTRYQRASSTHALSTATPIPREIEAAWDNREIDYRGQVLAGEVPPSKTRLSHRLDNGYCVLQHGGQPAIWTNWDPEGRLVVKKVFTDNDGNCRPIEVEVIFASDILRTLWTCFQEHDTKLHDDAVVREIGSRYVGIRSEDILFVYGLHKQSPAPKTNKAVCNGEGSEAKPRRRQKNSLNSPSKPKNDAAGNDSSKNTDDTSPPKAASDLRAELNAYVQQALFCAHGRILEEHWKLSSKNMDRGRRLEVEKVLENWTRFCTGSSAKANELARPQ